MFKTAARELLFNCTTSLISNNHVQQFNWRLFTNFDGSNRSALGYLVIRFSAVKAISRVISSGIIVVIPLLNSFIPLLSVGPLLNFFILLLSVGPLLNSFIPLLSVGPLLNSFIPLLSVGPLLNSFIPLLSVGPLLNSFIPLSLK